MSAFRRHALHPNVRRSPYFAETERAGAVEYMVYNHMYMPIAYGRDPREDYRALTERVTLWDVGAQRQTELRGPDALRLADYLCTRDLRDLAVGRCRYTMVCDEDGRIMTEPIVLRPAADLVWISHGDVDLTLWAHAIARSGFDVRVGEPDVAPLQVQGPRASAVLRDLGLELEAMRSFDCWVVRLAGVDAVLSRTGWSRELGYELYPLGSERAPALWRAILAAGERQGLLVTGPNLSRALEQGITDTHYAVNSGMNPFEAGAGRVVDLDAGPFVGRDALVAARRAGIERHTLGLVFDGDAVPRFESFWPVTAGPRHVGVVRWAAYAFALERHIAIALLDRRVRAGDRVTVEHGEGAVPATVVELPFVST
jgi:glycine cleavage system aminomethyltransferase T